MDFGHLGTPLFMAPEQLRGGARSTPWRRSPSFCAALSSRPSRRRALPGGKDTVETITARRAPRGAKSTSTPPPKSNPPVRVSPASWRAGSLGRSRRALAGSMDELVAALQRDPTRTRRWWSLAAGALAARRPVDADARARRRTGWSRSASRGPSRLADVWESTAPPSRRIRDATRAVEQGLPRERRPRRARRSGSASPSLLDRYSRGVARFVPRRLRGDTRAPRANAGALDLRMACLGKAAPRARRRSRTSSRHGRSRRRQERGRRRERAPARSDRCAGSQAARDLRRATARRRHARARRGAA